MIKMIDEINIQISELQAQFLYDAIEYYWENKPIIDKYGWDDVGDLWALLETASRYSEFTTKDDNDE